MRPAISFRPGVACSATFGAAFSLVLRLLTLALVLALRLTLSAAQKSTYAKENSGAHSCLFREVGILVPFECGATRSREADWRVPLGR